MAICIRFKLLQTHDTTAVYSYGDCSENLEGTFELDLEKLIASEPSLETDMKEIVKVLKPSLSETKDQHQANKAFSKIYKHYKETKEYLLHGGYYA
ncbi:hypothetical protein [Saccharibacillus sp. JS10]|uniref:hypothetical protein n=1 Tax=Saccharibacillus sp. JS10 TaxID=2950552 RepID=UPI00210E9DC3|nr:hypothetical protein [Saccharibacillus sp. JS10]MCQ4088417.1 hypothetical protein [Saccharibacillus sp. JS10]